MTTATITGTDVHVRNGVVRQLDWDPEVDASAIGVTAKEGVVTLTGFAESYAEKLAAERVATRVRGVRAVANDITVRLMIDRTDADIAHDAVQAIALRPALGDTVQIAVHRGYVTLTGQVEWLIQKEVAERAVKHVRGILGVFNHITVKPAAARRNVQRRIVQTLHHHADLDARQIKVEVNGDTAILTGTVHSWTQREAAERAAGSAFGITMVDNRILVEPLEPYEPEPLDEIC